MSDKTNRTLAMSAVLERSEYEKVRDAFEQLHIDEQLLPEQIQGFEHVAIKVPKKDYTVVAVFVPKDVVDEYNANYYKTAGLASK